MAPLQKAEAGESMVSMEGGLHGLGEPWPTHVAGDLREERFAALLPGSPGIPVLVLSPGGPLEPSCELCVLFLF